VQVRRGLKVRTAAAVWLALAVMAACGRGTSPPPAAEASAGGSAVVRPAAAGPRIVFLGDSLTAGYGLDASEAYPSLIQDRLRVAGLNFEVVNAGVSGDTSAGGLSRIDWSLDGDVRVLVVALGGNDALRGLGTAELERNLGRTIERARGRGVRVILAGMEAPPNLGPAYSSAFRAVYRDLASRHGVALIPFLLDGVAGDARLNQADGIHPNAAGSKRVADLVWPYVERAAREATHDD
jgi:acyl-CoA thioesterase-1